jgi:hypothetical protein
MCVPVLCHQLDSGVHSLAMLAAHHTQQYPQIPVIAVRAGCCGVRLNEGSYTVLIKVIDWYSCRWKLVVCMMRRACYTHAVCQQPILANTVSNRGKCSKFLTPCSTRAYVSLLFHW